MAEYDNDEIRLNLLGRIRDLLVETDQQRAEVERLRAENEDLRSRVTVLSPDDFDALCKALDTPTGPNEKLREFQNEVKRQRDEIERLLAENADLRRIATELNTLRTTEIIKARLSADGQ